MTTDTQNSVLKARPESLDSKILFSTIFAWALVFLGFLIGLFGLWKMWQEPMSTPSQGHFSLTNLSFFGSYLQGAVGSIWSLASFLFIYIAFLGQKQSLLLQNEQLAAQKKQFEAEQTTQQEELRRQQQQLDAQEKQAKEQLDSIKRQNFENSFFHLLNLHSQIVFGMKTDDVPHKKEVEGRNCFYFWFITLRNKFHEEKQEGVTGTQRYVMFYEKYQEVLGHYFRNLYHLFKFVKGSDIQDKRRYTSLARAQLSQCELVFLFYNGLSSYGEKFKPLIEEFGLLENLNRKLLFVSDEDKAYDPKAFN